MATFFLVELKQTEKVLNVTKIVKKNNHEWKEYSRKNSYSLRGVTEKITFQCQRRPRSSETLTNKNN